MVFGYSTFRSTLQHPHQQHHHLLLRHQSPPPSSPSQSFNAINTNNYSHMSSNMSSPSQPLTTTTNSNSTNNSRGGSSTNTAAVSSNSYHTQYFYAQNAPRLMSWEEITKALERNQNSKFFSQQAQSQQQQATYFSSLSPHQSSSSSGGQSGSQSIISRVDTNMYAANDPIEDRQAQEYDGPESFFAVYDGHAGDGCSSFLATHLIHYLKFRLYMRQKVRQQMRANTTNVNSSNSLNGSNHTNLTNNDNNMNNHNNNNVITIGNVNYQLSSMERMTDTEWNRAIETTVDERERKLLQDMRNMLRYTYGVPLVLREAFVYTDSVFCKGALVRMIKGKQVISNDLSGSCAILAYIQKNQLWVANAGDCRAILGRRDLRTGQLQAIALSRDQTAESEELRLRSEFPNEKDIVFDGRIKGGLQPSRSFGDIMYKEPVIGILLPDLIKNQDTWNPPYVKAEPEIQHIELDTRYDEFIVIASDGLWDMLQNYEVVQLVDQFMISQQQQQHHHYMAGSLPHHQRPITNASTFLIRQALLKSGYGHNDQEKLSNLMQLSTDLKRMLHDDITVTVIFLNKSYSISNDMTAATATTPTMTPTIMHQQQQQQQFQEIDSRGETEISPLYINVLKDFSELIAQENK